MNEFQVWGLALIGVGLAMLAVATTCIWPRIREHGRQDDDPPDEEGEFRLGPRGGRGAAPSWMR